MALDYLSLISGKIVRPEELSILLNLWRLEQQKVVFTNGCFDLLHAGHVQYLAEAKNIGQKLIVGLNSDASVKRLKGENRPINDENTRSKIMAALMMVDAVVIFDEETPFELIQLIQPDVLVKGGDYTIENIVGADIVLAKGGEVKMLTFLEGYSTTKIEQKILQSVSKK
jgi:D-glycero-beta-D-manno-heptose 1-phosphate adenylyltransferase